MCLISASVGSFLTESVCCEHTVILLGYCFCWAVDERITFSLLNILETTFFQTHQYNVNLVYCSRYWGKFEGLNSPFEMEYMQCQASWNGWKSFSAFKNWHPSSYCRATYLMHYKSRNLLGLYSKFCLHKGNMNVIPLRTAGYSRDFCNKVFLWDKGLYKVGKEKKH